MMERRPNPAPSGVVRRVPVTIPVTTRLFLPFNANGWCL